MSIQMLSRFGIAACLVALVSGCSFFGHSSDDHGAAAYSSECRSNPKSCQYEGHYEPGEENYAVQEAKRLNEAQSARLRSW